MSANPRRLLSDTSVSWGEPGSPPWRVRRGTIIDITPGSALEAAHGGAGNLQNVTADLGSADTLDKSWLAN